MSEIVSWQDGKWIPNSIIGTTVWDAHYILGWAIFDAFRTYNHIPHMFMEHIDRYFRSAKLAAIKIPYTKEEIIEVIYEFMDRNKFEKDEEYRFMLFASPGNFKIYDDMGKPNTIVTINATTTSRYARFIAPYLKTGYTSLISKQTQIPSRFLDPKIKHCSRLHYGLGEAEAANYGPEVRSVLLDEHGYLAESTGSNIAVIKNGEVNLPYDDDLLRGCTMDAVEKVCKEIGVPVIRKNIPLYDLVNADCLFYTSTFLGLVPSYKVLHRNEIFNLGKQDNETFENIITNYDKSVGVDTRKQWIDWYEAIQ
jgi:branched-subunit amino acid aminotransferase/4-amino-4-deoxychorismate lyase